MAFIPAENTLKVVLEYLCNGEIAQNVFYTQLENVPDPANMATVGNKIVDWWVNNMAPLTTLSCSLQTVTLTDLTVANSFQVVITSGLPEVGSKGDSELPNNVTVVTKFTTGLSGRSFRGRSYFVGLDASVVATGGQTVQGGFATDLGEAWEQLATDLGDVDADWVVASFYSGVDTDGKPIPRAEAVLTEIIQASTETTLDSQRRRLPGRGN